MITRAEYVLAKYIPEVHRNEPRNFGVIVWTEWGVLARFVGEDKGMLDLRKAPSWIQSGDAYKEWVNHWRKFVSSKKVSLRDGTLCTSESSRFLEAIMKTSKGNYLLSDRGSILEEVTKDDSMALLDYLFKTLVEPEADKQAAKLAFDIERECNRIIREAGISNREKLHRNKAVLCNISPEVIEEFEFDYYIGNGVPEALYQRVPLGQRGLDTTIHATAWQFENVIRQNVASRDNTAALIMPTDEQREDDRYLRAISVLKTQTRVFDLGREAQKFAQELEKYRSNNA